MDKKMNFPLLTELFIVEANVTTLAQMNKIPLSVAQKINDFDRQNSPTLASIFSSRYRQILDDQKFKDEDKMRYADEWMRGMGLQISKILKKKPTKKQELEKLAKTNYRDFLKTVTDLKKDIESLVHRAMIKFPDGHFWVKLDRDTEWASCGDKMQHCGQPLHEEGEIYQLIDNNGEYKVTIEMTPDKRVIQIKGKQNTFPDKKYWKYVFEFLDQEHAENKENLTPVEFYDAHYEIENKRHNYE